MRRAPASRRGAALFLSWSNAFYTPDQHGTLGTIDASTRTYALLDR